MTWVEIWLDHVERSPPLTSATGGSFRAVREIDVEMCGRSRDSAERLLRALKRQDRRSAPPTLHITLARLDEAARGEAARTGPASLA